MLRAIWQRAKDYIYDSLLGVFRSQAEIDQSIEDQMSDYGTVVYLPTDIPNTAKRRRVQFWSHEDAIHWIDDGGIPPDYVYILVQPDWDAEGNSAYFIYVEDGN